MTERITASHVKLKRAYEPATADDGTRVLIDRLWPREGQENGRRDRSMAQGYRADSLAKKWFGHEPEPPVRRRGPPAS